MLEELKEKYIKIILWFLGLLLLISLLAHFSLKSIVEEETSIQQDNEKMIKILEAVQKAEEEQAQTQAQTEPEPQAESNEEDKENSQEFYNETSPSYQENQPQQEP